ncbi:unnamed protein product [Durusdinium trenchii]|uniref:Uncharacterized protein n=1 Tax=Durusdinium trenchii TaxID=1381693 RepID=A0ABP0QPZ6_9DINO
MVRTMYGAGKLQRTPEEVERSCTDCCCLITYLAVCTGLVACIWQAFEKGDIHRLTSLPDYQGTQCVDKYIFFSGELPSGHYRHKPPSTRLRGLLSNEFLQLGDLPDPTCRAGGGGAEVGGAPGGCREERKRS